jgi:phage portal protein BeeE
MTLRPYGSLQGTPREPRLTRREFMTAGAAAAVVKDSAAVTSTLGGLGWPQPMLYAALGGYASNTGVPVTPFTALQAAAVYGCIRAISQDIAMLSPFIRRKLGGGGYKRELRHPLNKVFVRPNRWQTWFEFIGYAVTSLCLRGNAFVVVERDNDANPIELVPIAPDRCTIMLTDDGELWYRINSRRLGYGLLVPPDDMIHIKNISMDGYVGVSPIAIAQDVIGLALATQQHGSVILASCPRKQQTASPIPGARHTAACRTPTRLRCLRKA